MNTERNFVAYEYCEIITERKMAAVYLDSYPNFGWQLDESGGVRATVLRFKRDRKILNKSELTRLQRQFNAALKEIQNLERSRNSSATVVALIVGILATACMAVAVFAVTANPPNILLCIAFAIPAFMGWILPYFIYQKIQQVRSKKIAPLIEEKYEQMYELCEKGYGLLPGNMI